MATSTPALDSVNYLNSIQWAQVDPTDQAVTTGILMGATKSVISTASVGLVEKWRGGHLAIWHKPGRNYWEDQLHPKVYEPSALMLVRYGLEVKNGFSDIGVLVIITPGKNHKRTYEDLLERACVEYEPLVGVNFTDPAGVNMIVRKGHANGRSIWAENEREGVSGLWAYDRNAVKEWAGIK